MIQGVHLIRCYHISYEKLLGGLPSGRGRQAPESVLHLDYKHSYFKHGFIDINGNLIVPCQWKGASSFHEGMARVTEDNGKWDGGLTGFINKEGELVCPCIWEFAWDFSGGLALVEDSNLKYGFIDKSGKLAIPCQWDFAESFDNGRAKVRADDEEYYIDQYGNRID